MALRMALAFAVLAPIGLAGQDAPVPEGLWTGGLASMNHPDRNTPLQYFVTRSDQGMAIQIRGPGDLRLPTTDVVASDGHLRFTFREPEGGVSLRCDLYEAATGVFDGRCTDATGKWARLIMRPPEQRADW
jgi:hypothetical protein